jgi:O-antigen ligase
LREDEKALAYIYVLMTAFMAVALVFSLSRMGLGSFLMSLVIVVMLIKLSGGEQNVGRSLGLGLLAIIVTGVLWIGVDVVVERYGQLIDPEQQRAGEDRPQIFRDTLKMIAAHPFGVGAGKYQDIFRRYQSHDGDVLFDHTHNDYLETAAEWGVIPAAIFWIFIIAVLVRSMRGFRSLESDIQRGILLACIGSIIALMIHNLADFNLQIPVNAALFFSFLGLAAALGANTLIEDEIPEHME